MNKNISTKLNYNNTFPPGSFPFSGCSESKIASYLALNSRVSSHSLYGTNICHAL